MIRADRFLSVVTGIVLSLALSVLMLAILLEGCGTSAALMSAMMRQDAPSASTGLPEGEYDAMAEMITGYLAGTTDPFQYTLTADDGSQAVLFHDYEQQHMADCRSLFVLCRTVILLSAVLTAAAVLVIALRRDLRRTAQGSLAGACFVLTAVAALCVWAAVDFDGLFILFHRLSFSNSLWLLNPQTDLLIRLMPLPFFVHYVILIAAGWLTGVLLIAGISLALLHRAKRHGTRGA